METREGKGRESTFVLVRDRLRLGSGHRFGGGGGGGRVRATQASSSSFSLLLIGSRVIPSITSSLRSHAGFSVIFILLSLSLLRTEARLEIQVPEHAFPSIEDFPLYST